MASITNQKNVEVGSNPIENTVVYDSESSEDYTPPARCTQRIQHATNATTKAELVEEEEEEEEEDDEEEEEEEEEEVEEEVEEEEEEEEVEEEEEEKEKEKEKEKENEEEEEDESEEEDEGSSGSGSSESENEHEVDSKQKANSVKPEPAVASKVETESRMVVKKGPEAALTPMLKEPKTPLARPNNFAIPDKKVVENGVVAVMKVPSPLAEVNNKSNADNRNNVDSILGKRAMQKLSRDNNNENKKRAMQNLSRDNNNENKKRRVDTITSPLVNPFLSPNQVDGAGSDHHQSRTFTTISFPDEISKYIFSEGVQLLSPAAFSDLERRRKDHQIKQIQHYIQSSTERNNLVCLHAQRIMDCLKED